MTRAYKYLKSFGNLTEEQEKIVKESFNYKAALLADTGENLGKEISNELKLLIKKLRGN